MSDSLGRVTKVRIEPDEDAIFVNVTTSPTQDYRGLRFRTPGVGAWFVPSKGDVVVVESVGGRKVAHTPYNVPDYGMPSDLNEGDIAFRLNADTLLHFKETDSGYDIEMKCDGDLYLDGTDVFIGDSNNAEKVARADHTHDFTDSGGDTGTTDTENESPTDTFIE